MSQPTTRILAVLELLQTHGRISGPEMAARLEVDGRTLRRYIAKLEELGMPITAERGRHGAYMLVAGFKLPPMMFTDDEALAVSVGLLAARSLGLAQAGPAVASAQAKLERVMPAGLKSRVRAVDETVQLELSEPQTPENNRALTVLSIAAQEARRVHLAYRSEREQRTERDFDPYGLVYRHGCWYVAGMCHLRRGLRTFRLDRVEDVEPLTVAFVRPPGFDAAAHLTWSIATMPHIQRIEVLLHTDLKTALRDLTPTLGLFEPHPEGVLLRGGAETLEWFARQLARASFAFEVLTPETLREEVRACGRRLLAAGEAGGRRTDA
jgi:predicted DNA-binding transcriptional regulator YafY